MRYFFLFMLLACPRFVYPQQVSVYFGNDEYSLNTESITTLDHVLHQLDTSKHYLVGLVGYADSTHTKTYNLALASKRVESVRTMLMQKLPGKRVRYKTMSHGEDRPFFSPGNAYDKALNRKVEICFAELTPDSKVLYSAPNGIKLKVSVNEADSCPVCESASKLVAEMGPDEILRVVLQNCSKTNLPCAETEMRIPGEYYRSISGTRSIAVDIFTRCGITEVPDTLYLDREADEYVFIFRCLHNVNVCCATPGCRQVIKLPAFTANRFIYRGKDYEVITDDSLQIQTRFCDSLEILNIGKINNRYYVLHTSTDQLAVGFGYGIKFYTLLLSQYSALKYCDTLLKVKVRNGTKGDKVAFYLKEYKYHLPLEQVSKKKHRDYIAVKNYDLSVNEKFKDRGYKIIRTKYRKRKKQLKVVVRKTPLN